MAASRSSRARWRRGEYNPGGGTTAGFYSYFKNFPHSGPELYLGAGAAHFVFPTNDGEVCIGVEMTADKFKAFRGDLAENMSSDLSVFRATGGAV